MSSSVPTFSYEAEVVLNCPYCGRDANPDVQCPGCFRVSTQKQMLGEEQLDGVRGKVQCRHGDKYRSRQTGECSRCK